MHQPAPAWLERAAFVLVRPSHPGNVGAVARAMRTMGLRRLVVVAPRDPDVLSNPVAVARASGAARVLHEAVLAQSLAEALAPFTLAVAVSAEAREFGPVPQPPETSARSVRSALRAEPQAQVAFVFGTERTGLSVDDTLPCQLMCSIPGVDAYHSLNLAQAAQIIAYCLRSLERLEPQVPGAAAMAHAPGDAHPVGSAADGLGIARAREGESTSECDSRRHRGLAANFEQIDGLFAHLETALVRIGFLDPLHPKKLMSRLRRLFGRTHLEVEEVAILRGVCTQVIKLADGDIHGPSRPRTAVAPMVPGAACRPEEP